MTRLLWAIPPNAGGGLTQAEADALYDTLGAAAAAVATHEGAGDPHPQYQTQAEGDARYGQLAAAATWAADQLMHHGLRIDTTKYSAQQNARDYMMAIQPSGDAVDGIVIKRPSSTYGAGHTANLFSIIRDGANPSDLNSAIIAHINEWGGGGVQTWHVRPGKNQLDADDNYTGANGILSSGAALWIENHFDFPTMVIDRHADAATWSFSYLKVRDLSGAAYTLADLDLNGVLRLYKGAEFQGRADADVVLALKRYASTQTGRLLQFLDETDAEIAYVSKDGQYVATALVPASRARILISANAAQTADLFDVLNSSGSVLSRFDKNGYFMTRRTTPPADGDFGSAAELALWYDADAGTPRIVFKTKDGAGNIRSMWLPYTIRQRVFAGVNPTATAIGSVGGHTMASSGTVANADDVDGSWISCTTGSVSGNTAGVNSAATASSGIFKDWSPEHALRMKTGASLASIRLWIGLISGDPTASADPAVHALAFRYDTGAGDTHLMAYSKDGATATIVDTGVTPTTDTEFRFRIVYQQVTGQALFYVNEKLVATITTHLPGSATRLYSYCMVTTLAASAKVVKYGHDVVEWS